MKLENILALGAVLVFLILILFTKTPRKFYIYFVLIAFPFIDLAITPIEMGGLRVFDGISYIAFFILFKDYFFLRKEFVYKKYNYLFILFFIAILCGSLSSIYVGNSLFTILSVLPLFIFSKALIAESIEDASFQNKILKILKVVTYISIIFLSIQILVGLNFTFYSSLNRNTTLYGSIRYPSFFHDPQKYGQFLVLTCFLFLVNYRNLAKPMLANYAQLLVVLFALLQTGGRTALLAMLAGLLLLFFVLGRGYKMVLLGLCFLGGIVVTSLSEKILVFNRVEDMNKDYLYRASLWDEALRFFDNHQMLGIGLGNYRMYAKSYSDNFYIDEDNKEIYFDQPESGYLMILTETGFVGAFLVGLFFLLPIVNGISLDIAKRKLSTSFFLVASLVSWLITFISVFSLNDRRISTLVIAFLCFLIVKHKDKVSNEISN